MTQHHYTDTPVKTAAAAANAGTCLEDGNTQNNIFSNIGDAVKAVSYMNIIWWQKYIHHALYIAIATCIPFMHNLHCA